MSSTSSHQTSRSGSRLQSGVYRNCRLCSSVVTPFMLVQRTQALRFIARRTRLGVFPRWCFSRCPFGRRAEYPTFSGRATGTLRSGPRMGQKTLHSVNIIRLEHGGKLCIYTVKFNPIPFLSTIRDNNKGITSIHLENRSKTGA